MPTEIPYAQREECIPQDEFRLALQTSGQTLVRHRPVYNDPSVLKQRWSITPSGNHYDEKAFYTAFDQTPFRHALRFLVTNPLYTLDQLASLHLSVEQFAFLEEQQFLVKTPSWCIEERHVLGFTVTGTKKMCWQKGPASQKCSNIGHTLEWYVAEWFRNEYHALARHGVETQELLPAGDLDVVAFKEDTRVMVECKSASKIEEKKLRHFLQRTAGFQPDMALLLIDTDNSDAVEIRTKQLCTLLNQPYNAIQRQKHGKTVFRWIPAQNIYVTNTGAGIAATLAAVIGFHDALKQVRAFR